MPINWNNYYRSLDIAAARAETEGRAAAKAALKLKMRIAKERHRAKTAIKNEENFFNFIKDEDNTVLETLLIMDEKKVMKALKENNKGALCLFYFKNPKAFLELAMKDFYADLDTADEFALLKKDSRKKYYLKLSKAALNALLEDLYKSADNLVQTDKAALEKVIDQSLAVSDDSDDSDYSYDSDDSDDIDVHMTSALYTSYKLGSKMMAFYLTYAKSVCPEKLKAVLNHPDEEDPLFFRMIRAKKIHEEKELLNYITAFKEAGFDISVQNDKGRTLLHYAAKHNFPEVISYLLENGVDKNLQDKNDTTALQIANQYRNSEAIKLLIDVKAYLNLQEDSKCTSIFRMTKTQSNVLSYISAFEKAGDDISVQNDKKRTLLHYAAKHNLTDVINYLLEKGVDQELRDKNNETALQLAFRKGAYEAVQLLIDPRANLNLQEENKSPLVFRMIETQSNENHEEIKILSYITAFEEAGVDISVQNLKKRTLLHYAAKHNLTDVINYLLEKGVDKDQQDEHNETALHLAFRHEANEAVQLLIAAKANLNLKDINGSPVFFSMIEQKLVENHEEKEVLDDIIDLEKAGADFSVQNDKKRTLLHYAAKHNFTDVINYLLEKAVDIDLQDKNAETALHLAYRNGANDAVQLLIHKEANLNLKDKNKRPVFFSMIKDKIKGYHWEEEILRDIIALGKAGADFSLQNDKGRTLLHYAAKHNLTDVINYLLEKDVDKDLQDKYNKTPLYLASQHQANEAVKLLLDAEADRDLQDETGNSALHIAVERNNIDIVKSLLVKGANPDILDANNNSPLKLALSLNKNEIVVELRKASADIARLSPDMQMKCLFIENGIQNVDAGKTPDYKMLIESFRKYARPHHNEYLAGLSRFFHGQWNHHHSKALTTLLLKTKYRQDTIDKEVFNEFMLELDQAIDLSNINPDGALSRLLTFTSEQTGKDWKDYSSVNEGLRQLQGSH